MPAKKTPAQQAHQAVAVAALHLAGIDRARDPARYAAAAKDLAAKKAKPNRLK